MIIQVTNRVMSLQLRSIRALAATPLQANGQKHPHRPLELFTRAAAGASDDLLQSAHHFPRPRWT